MNRRWTGRARQCNRSSGPTRIAASALAAAVHRDHARPHADHIRWRCPCCDDVDLLHDELELASAAAAETRRFGRLHTAHAQPRRRRDRRAGRDRRGSGQSRIGLVGRRSRVPALPLLRGEGARLAQDAQTSAMISNISFATIAGLTGGALLWFTLAMTSKSSRLASSQPRDARSVVICETTFDALLSRFRTAYHRSARVIRV